jgi:dCMP deaminase
MQNGKWDERFLQLAEHVASWSKDPSTQVGAVIVRPDRTIASVGFNGFPRGVPDKPEWLADRQKKNLITIHAEQNAILNARDQSLADYTIYTTFHPCAACASKIVQAGITRVVCWFHEHPDRWAESFNLAQELFRSRGVEFLLVVDEPIENDWLLERQELEDFEGTYINESEFDERL